MEKKNYSFMTAILLMALLTMSSMCGKEDSSNVDQVDVETVSEVAEPAAEEVTIEADQSETEGAMETGAEVEEEE